MDIQDILSLLSLIALQNALGIDNEIFISILTENLPVTRKRVVHVGGLILAAVLRISFLFAINIFLGSETILFNLGEHTISLKGLILILGGFFLIFSSTREIHRKMEVEKHPVKKKTEKVQFARILLNIFIVNVIFSLGSIITAVGIAEEKWVMYAGVLTGIVIMLVASANIAKFLEKHLSLKILAFCFLFIIGFVLICEGFGVEVPKSYIYFIMIFTVIIDFILMKIQGKKIKPAR